MGRRQEQAQEMGVQTNLLRDRKTTFYNTTFTDHPQDIHMNRFQKIATVNSMSDNSYALSSNPHQKIQQKNPLTCLFPQFVLFTRSTKKIQLFTIPPYFIPLPPTTTNTLS
jgi:hypothetical protein